MSGNITAQVWRSQTWTLVSLHMWTHRLDPAKPGGERKDCMEMQRGAPDLQTTFQTTIKHNAFTNKKTNHKINLVSLLKVEIAGN